MSHTELCRVTSGSEVIGMQCSVTDNGGVVRIYLPDNDAQRFRSWGHMKFDEKRTVGATTVYRGWHDGHVVSWSVTPNPCRSCK